MDTPNPADKPSKFVDVEFENPIVRGAQTIAQVTLRKPGGGELRGLQIAALLNMDVNAIAKLVPRISNPILTEADVFSLEADDLTELSSKVTDFLLTTRHREAFQGS